MADKSNQKSAAGCVVLIFAGMFIFMVFSFIFSFLEDTEEINIALPVILILFFSFIAVVIAVVIKTISKVASQSQSSNGTETKRPVAGKTDLSGSKGPFSDDKDEKAFRNSRPKGNQYTFCPFCGARISTGSKHCKQCGNNTSKW
jgi:hypothetical protein